MITEDYCSFEVAKMLKEKGFNESIRCWYDNYQDFHEEGVKMSNTDCLPSTIMCPTHQMAMKWILEKYNVYIEVSALKRNYWVYTIYKILDNKVKELYNNGEFKSHEEAVEAALKYCLENLI